MTYNKKKRKITRRAGRRVKEMTPQAAKTEAQRLLPFVTPHLWEVIDILAQAGVLSVEQLSFIVSYKTLSRDYAPQRIVDRLPYTHTELKAAFTAHGFAYTAKKTNLYALGPVGVELALLRPDNIQPVTGFMAYTLTRVMHDVCLNESMLRLSDFAIEHGWDPYWDGPNQAALYSADGSRQLLAPDAKLTVKRGAETRHFLVEYHNEDHRTRAERKIDKYINVGEINAACWQEAWDTDTFPPVLAVFAKRIVGEGYRDKLKGRNAPVYFYGKLLEGVLSNSLEIWANFTTRQKETIWEDSLAEENVPPPTEP
ncbi:MAG: hypothetical protein GY803_19160 [Chloroflexi bacterium]|nr:hypothetical protein [Chloroflexota bacterium]